LTKAGHDVVLIDQWSEHVQAMRQRGLLGRSVKIVVYNDEASQTVAQQLYNRLLDQDQADLVLAPFSTQV